MLSIMDLPDELHLLIQSHFPLPTLLTARAVCKLWHSTIPGPHIPTYRRQLLTLYLRAIASPSFKATRKEVLLNVKSFDRRRMLEKLSKGQDVPDEFACWLLEWPERAVFGSAWPGLQSSNAAAASHSALSRDKASSLLRASSPLIIHRIILDSPNEGEMEIVPAWVDLPKAARTAAGLLLDDACVDGWQRSQILMLSGISQERSLAGCVYQVDGVRGQLARPVCNSWTEYLHQELSREEEWLSEHPTQT